MNRRGVIRTECKWSHMQLCLVLLPPILSCWFLHCPACLLCEWWYQHVVVWLNCLNSLWTSSGWEYPLHMVQTLIRAPTDHMLHITKSGNLALCMIHCLRLRRAAGTSTGVSVWLSSRLLLPLSGRLIVCTLGAAKLGAGGNTTTRCGCHSNRGYTCCGGSCTFLPCRPALRRSLPAASSTA